MTVIYNMSIDRADKPWIGDRRLTECTVASCLAARPARGAAHADATCLFCSSISVNLVVTQCEVVLLAHGARDGTPGGAPRAGRAAAASLNQSTKVSGRSERRGRATARLIWGCVWWACWWDSRR